MIEILDAKKQTDQFEGASTWICWLELSRGNGAWLLPAAAPGELEETELQAHFDAQESQLWAIAQQKRYQPDIILHLRERELLIRLVKVILSEINILRDVAGLPPRTLEQLKRALKGAQ